MKRLVRNPYKNKWFDICSENAHETLKFKRCHREKQVAGKIVSLKEVGSYV